MTRAEFIQELTFLLSDIPEEERREAIEFYENYFEEAGKEQEEKVISELGSPAEIAESIKKSLEYGNKDTGYFTEDGYHESYKEKANLPSFERHFTGEGQKEKDSKNTFTEYEKINSGYTGKDEKNSNYRQEEAYSRSYSKEERKQKKGPVNIALLILLILFALPIGLPIVITIAALLFAAVVTVASLWIAFAAVAVSLLVAGIAVGIIGVVQLSVTPALGLSLAGGGLIILGIGILFTIASVWIAGKAIPAVIGWVKQIFSNIFRRRRAYA